MTTVPFSLVVEEVLCYVGHVGLEMFASKNDVSAWQVIALAPRCCLCGPSRNPNPNGWS